LSRGSEGDVERATNGEILHRRLPSTGSGSGSTGGIFQYDPHATDTTLPSEMHRDGNTHPMPELTTDPGEDEAVLTENGFVPADDTPDSSDVGEDPSADTPPDGTQPDGGDPDGAPPDGAPTTAPASPDGATPDGIQPGNPGDTEDPPGGPPVVDPRAFLGDKAAPDRETQREGRLDYHAVFDPSIVPFKRNRALNAVNSDYGVVLRQGHVEELTPTGIRTEAGRESFWGSILLEGRAGQPIPLPSVAPSSRILRAEVVPPIPLTFLKDNADNFYVKPAKDGRFRLVFVMDAPTSYFGRELPSTSVRLSDVPRAKLPPIPAKVRRAATQFASELGLSPRGQYTPTLKTLVNHFRSFAPGDPPPPTTDIYLDLARAKKGICRHRSFGFVVTALALGIPARYVFNEAHVFVEVYVPGPDPGWLRVDLGGGADSLHVHSGQDKLQHQPRVRDPFDQPAPFAESHTDRHMAGALDVRGAPPRARSSEASTAAASEPATSGSAASAAKMRFRVTRPMATPGARSTATSLSLSQSHAFRGDGVTAFGKVRHRGGAGAVTGNVQVVLADATTGEPIRLLASAQVDEEGKFEVTFTYPADQAPGKYEVKAQFMGNGTSNPSMSP